jgi:hypothetical protein
MLRGSKVIRQLAELHFTFRFESRSHVPQDRRDWVGKNFWRVKNLFLTIRDHKMQQKIATSAFLFPFTVVVVVRLSATQKSRHIVPASQKLFFHYPSSGKETADKRKNNWDIGIKRIDRCRKPGTLRGVLRKKSKFRINA